VPGGRAQGRSRGGGGEDRERERGGELTSGSKSGDHRLQNLGHHRERERGGGEEVAARENQMRERERREGRGTFGGRDRAPGSRGPERAGWAGLGRAGSCRGAKTHD
jgi:ribonuclease G